MARLMAMMSAKKDEGCPLVLVSWGHGENREEVDDDDAVSRLKKLDVSRQWREHFRGKQHEPTMWKLPAQSKY